MSLTLFLNDLVSGYVAGASSGAYYGLVMAEVLGQVFGGRRVFAGVGKIGDGEPFLTATPMARGTMPGLPPRDDFSRA